MVLKDGYTLMHEHMSIDLTPGDLGTDSFEALCRDLQTAYGYGVSIGVDMIGKETGRGDCYRADTVCKVKEWGYLSQLVLSLDLCRVQDLRSSGSYGYAHLFEVFLPMLNERGITQSDIDLMLKENPKRIFA